MNQEQLNKIDDFFLKASQKKIGLDESSMANHQEFSNIKEERSRETIKQLGVLSAVNGFKALKEEKNKKYRN